MKRILLALATVLFCTPALAAPPTYNITGQIPPNAAILYCLNTASGPPYVASAADSTHGCGPNTTAVTQSGTWTVQPGNTPNSTPWLMTLTPSTSGGTSTYSANVTTAGSGAGTGGVVVDASPGQLYAYEITNNNSSICYIQFFDVAQATVNLGTTAPKKSIGIPALGGANFSWLLGVPFGTAITIGVTTTRAGSTACSTGLDINIDYK